MNTPASIVDTLITGKGRIFGDFEEVAPPTVFKLKGSRILDTSDEEMEAYALHTQFVHLTRNQLYQLLSDLPARKLSEIQQVLDELRD